MFNYAFNLHYLFLSYKTFLTYYFLCYAPTIRGNKPVSDSDQGLTTVVSFLTMRTLAAQCSDVV